MEDEEIYQLYWKRSEQAITATHEKYGSWCQGIAYRILSTREETEECVSDTYLTVWNRIPPQKPRIFRAWLGRITRNLALTRYEYASAQKRAAFVEVAISELEECIPDTAASPEARAEQKELSLALNRFLSGLDPLDCALFLGRYYYNQNASELGQQQGIRAYQVKYRLKKLRAELKRFLEKEGYTQ